MLNSVLQHYSMMRNRTRNLLVIIVENNPADSQLIVSLIAKVNPDATVKLFHSAEKALAWEGIALCNVAFVEIDLPEMNGLDFARRLKTLNSRINIVLTTSRDDCFREAVEMRCSGYIMKPVTPALVREEFENLRFPPHGTGNRRLKAQCFGFFTLFCDGKPIAFKRKKSLEMFAFLIDRNGALCSTKQIEAVLWEGQQPSKSYVHVILNDIKATLQKLDVTNVLTCHHGLIGINRQEIECDYHDYLDYLEFKPSGKPGFRGEYMSQYSWAEATLSLLEKYS